MPVCAEVLPSAFFCQSNSTATDVYSVVGVLLGPLLGFLDGLSFVVLPVVGDGLVQGVVAVWSRHQSLD